MFENVDGRTDVRRTTDAEVTGILLDHLGAFGSGELKMEKSLLTFALNIIVERSRTFFFLYSVS